MKNLLKSLKIVDAKSPEHAPKYDEGEEEAIQDALHADEIMAGAQADDPTEDAKQLSDDVEMDDTEGEECNCCCCRCCGWLCVVLCKFAGEEKSGN